MAQPEKKPNVFQKLLLGVSDIIPMHGLGVPLGLISLVARRSVMDSVNLYEAPLEPGTTDSPPDYRLPSGEGNDAAHVHAGADNTAFGRNMPPALSYDPHDGPPAQEVAAKLLERRGFKPAGAQLNVLAAAWIQAMAHDWFGHVDSDETETLSNSTSGCPLGSFSFKKTKRRADGAFDNFRTHWWDSSFVYGQNAEAVARGRTFEGGKLHETKTAGLLASDEEGRPLVGDMKNGWLGVGLLQDIFAREHNAIAEAIVAAYPHLKDEDEKVFNYARLAVAAIVAKIHTVDWTCELLKTDTLEAGMKTNWYGLAKGLGVPFAKGPPGLLSLVANKTDNKGVPYCLTEEFVSVYRLHPLLPDGLLVETDGFVPLLDVVGLKGDEKLRARDGAAREYWDSVVAYPCGNLQLHNYPRGLREVPPTDDRGVQLTDEPVDLAALDIYRDRERGIRRYNDFRRGMFMKPYKSIAELCGEGTAECQALCEVYGEDGIESVDLQVGMLAEKKIKGFAISETAFNIFLLMASRRLEADRFFTENFDKETYTEVGLKWVQSVKGMREVMQRHFPEVEAKIPKGQSAFKPYRVWPEEYLK